MSGSESWNVSKRVGGALPSPVPVKPSREDAIGFLCTAFGCGWLLNSTRAEPRVPSALSARKCFPRNVLAYIVSLSGVVEESSDIASKSHDAGMMILHAKACGENGIPSVCAASYVVKSHWVRMLASVRVTDKGAPMRS